MKPALISASPWTGEEARAGLIERATAAVGRIGTHTVRIIPEPLQRKVDGQSARAVRVIVEGEQADVEGLEVLIADGQGSPLNLGRAASPAGSVRVMVPASDSSTDAEVRVPTLGDESVAVRLDGVRPWSVHVVHHSHFDFGYTDPQAAVIANQRSYLDSAVELINQTADWPEASRFRWNAEALWAFSDWESNRTRAEIDELVRLVREGSIGLSAMPYNLHTDTCSTDELHELLASARRIRDEYGIPFTSAMQTDVPGQVAGLPDALSDLGVRFLAVAHNWAGRSEPHKNGALDIPRLFRWRSAAGNSVLVWMTDSPHGLAYLEGPMVGFTESYETLETLFPAYLTALSTRGYPFPPGVFGAHGEEDEGRQPYPWDVLHVRTQGFNGDNGPARLHLSEQVRQWNETWEYPKLRVSRNEDFFEEAEERFGDELVTFEGDWGDWWVEGVGSGAVPLSLAREAQVSAPNARTISQLSKWSGGEAVAAEAADARAAYDSISMFNEHTWGASNSWTHGDEGYDSGERQWQWKVGHAIAAHQRTSDATEHALHHLAQAVAPADAALASYVVVNVAGHTRTSQARVLVKESHVPLDADFAVLDSRTGAVVPHTVEAQGNSLHRESGRWITFPVADAPGVGWVRFDLVAADEPAAAPVEYPLQSAPREELLVLENEHLRVEVDDRRSVIRSIVEKATGRDWVNTESAAGFNGYIYDTYGSSGAGVNHLANKLSVSPRLELLASRTVARPSIVIERVDDAVEQRLVYEFAADGVDSVQVTLRLRHGDSTLLIENRVSKPVTRVKESGYFAFPFAAEDPVVRFEVSGGVTGDGIAHIPGAPQHMRAIRNWVSVADGADAVAWATKDAPLVQTGSIALPYSPFPASTSPHEPATVYSWFHNNVWDTNFPIEQGFTATFTYAVGVRAREGQSVPSLAIETASAAARPLLSIPAAGRGATSAEESFVRVNDDRVALVGVGAADEAGWSRVRLQSFADEPVRLRLEVTGADAARRTTLLGDVRGDLAVEGGAVTLDLAPFETTAVEVRISRDD
ncbi:glycoside hydrolase family 38 C-terminal domain-containing protein [Microbacterium sp.]|uniref:glycoside hydrolase family 38 N-terminal domain-containing protein n=1 Tax=Microbacterium sp. TaxID=51671 RepID=UPI00273291D1|nr:glycoside hydrolase family 38 C-terminal domain-containing protein [Microbacterium sp.]MDP3951748.1 glycoside hydrolase family 38 C-terminal domain-containing protein [Microbacterium sp.]